MTLHLSEVEMTCIDTIFKASVLLLDLIFKHIFSTLLCLMSEFCRDLVVSSALVLVLVSKSVKRVCPAGSQRGLRLSDGNR